MNGDITMSDATGTLLVDGRDVSVDGTKLDTIETSATADQTDAEIETAYNNQVSVVSQAAAEAGTATTAERWTPQRVSQAIAALETAALSAAAIKTLYESNSNTNEYDDAEQTKLAGIETSATADQTGAEIKTAYEAEANAYTDTKDTKLSGIETSATADQSDAEIETAYNNQVAVVSQAAAEAGTSTTAERWSPLRIAQAIAALESP
jgi:microcystin-dependent protein